MNELSSLVGFVAGCFLSKVPVAETFPAHPVPELPVSQGRAGSGADMCLVLANGLSVEVTCVISGRKHEKTT